AARPCWWSAAGSTLPVGVNLSTTLGKNSARRFDAWSGSIPIFAASALTWSEPRHFELDRWRWTGFRPCRPQEANAPPQPLCENLLARPCNPPLCVRRPPRIPTSEFASPEASVFPLAAPSIESRSPIVCWILNVFYKTVFEERARRKGYFPVRT